MKETILWCLRHAVGHIYISCLLLDKHLYANSRRAFVRALHSICHQDASGAHTIWHLAHHLASRTQSQKMYTFKPHPWCVLSGPNPTEMKQKRKRVTGVYGPRTRLCTQLSTLRNRLVKTGNMVESKHRSVAQSQKEIRHLESKLQTLHEYVNLKRGEICTLNAKKEEMIAAVKAKEIALSQVKRLDLVVEWKCECQNLLDYLVTYHMNEFDGHVALLYMLRLNKSTHKQIKRRFLYNRTWTSQSVEPVQQIRPLASVLQSGNRVSILRQNHPNQRRRFDADEMAIFAQSAELKAWSERKILVHRVHSKTTYCYDLVPDVELTPATVQLCHEYGMVAGKRSYGNIFVRLDRYYRDKLWALDQAMSSQ